VKHGVGMKKKHIPERTYRTTTTGFRQAEQTHGMTFKDEIIDYKRKNVRQDPCAALLFPEQQTAFPGINWKERVYGRTELQIF
jgi:hypothetical protein